jgi:hypothetical protein
MGGRIAFTSSGILVYQRVYTSEGLYKQTQKAGYELGILPYQPILPVFSATRLSTALFSTGLFNVLSSPPSLYSLSHVSLIFSTVCYCIFLLIEPGAGIDHLCGRTGLARSFAKAVSSTPMFQFLNVDLH